MSRLAQPARLARALAASGDRQEALRLVRAAPELDADATAAALLELFHRSMRVQVRAERMVRAASALARVARSAFPGAVAQRVAGVHAHLRGRPRLARRSLERAVALYAQCGSWIDAGDVERILIDVLMLADDDGAARRAARRARRCYERAGRVDSRRWGSLSMNLGNLNHRRDAHEAALGDYARARRLFSRSGEPLRLANVDFNRANILATLDRVVEARRLYERARRVYAEHRSPGLLARAEAAIAVLDLLEGSFDRCRERLESLRLRFAALGDPQGMAHVDVDSAEVLLALNRPVEAMGAAARADRFFRRAGHLADSANCAGLLGGAALQRGQPVVAVRHFGRAARLQRRLGNRVAAALHEIGRARAESGQGRPRVAAARARRAARLLRDRGLQSREARALAVAADAALNAGLAPAAREMAIQARDLSRRRHDRRVELSALIVLARLDEREGRPGNAYRYLLAAERCVESLRRGVSSEESRLSFAADKSEVYEALVLNRLRRGGRVAVRQALVFAERGKARALAEHLAAGRLEWLSGGKTSVRRLAARLQRVERELTLAEARLEQVGSRPGLRSGREARLRSLTVARSTTLRNLARIDPARATMMGAAPPHPDEVIRELAADETVLEFTQAGDRIHAFVVQREDVAAVPDLAPLGEVRDAMDRLRFQLGKGVLWDLYSPDGRELALRALREQLERLHALLLEPLIHRLERPRLRIVPHGILHGLPFHALERDGRALVDDFVVSYAPSLAAVGLLARRPPGSASSPLVLGVADRSAPLIEREVEAVRRSIRGSVVCRGDRATRDALRPGRRRPPLLHVACHGFFSDSDAWASGLRLGDSWLSLPELYEIRDMADLVVLSGCQTGRGAVYSGDEWVGLVRGFLQAGARAVVASLWEVRDRATLELMRDFYCELARGVAVADALAVAQRKARRQEPMPLLWAPFATIGDPALRLPVSEAA